MGHSSKREVDSNTILSQEMRKTSNNNLNYQQQIKLQLKQLQIEEQTKSKVSRMKEIIKIRAEINKKEKKGRLIKLKAGSLRR